MIRTHFLLFIINHLLIWGLLQAYGEGSDGVVVIHDQSFVPDASPVSADDLLLTSALASVAAASHLPLMFFRKFEAQTLFRGYAEMPSVPAVISIGDCATTRVISSTVLRYGVSVLSIHTKPCEDKVVGFNSIPLYNALETRRFVCLIPELERWVSRPWKLKQLQVLNRNLTLRDHQSSYTECIGRDNVELLLNSPLAVASSSSSPLPLSLSRQQGRRYLNGRKLIIATIHRPPFVILKTSEKKIIGASGFCLTLLETLAAKFNFTYKLVPPYDGNWGNPMPNGTFNGMVGMVHRKEVDFAVAGLSITHTRATVIDFTQAFYEEPSTILIPAPTERNNILAFLDPYSWQVWTGILLAVGIVSPLMWVLASYCTSLPLLYPYSRSKRQSLYRYVWYCCSPLVAQGNEMPQTNPSRFLFGVWLIANLSLIYTYTGTLTAFLTFPVMDNLIDSLEALANQREILWTYRAGTAHDSLFGTAEPPGTYYKIGQLIREKPYLLVRSDQEGVEAVLNKKMAFIKEKSWLDFAMEQDYLKTRKCRLSQVPQLFFSAGFGWALQENSVYLTLFNTEILQMMQSGLFEVWKQNYWPKPNECTAGGGAATSAPSALEMKNFYGHFLILGIGCFISVIFLLGEMYFYRKWYTSYQARGKLKIEDDKLFIRGTKINLNKRILNKATRTKY